MNYRRHKGISQEEISDIPVIIQCKLDLFVSFLLIFSLLLSKVMVAAKSAGVCFTMHPVSGEDIIVINVGPGLGEHIVNGDLSPASIEVDKKSGEEISREGLEISEEIPKYAVKNLVENCVKIEKYFKFPCDIEFAFDGKDVFILQSRPITSANEICKGNEKKRKKKR